MTASGAFRLEVGAGRLATLVFDAPGRRVNVFTREVLAELEQMIAGLAELAGRRDVGCLVLLSGKEGFIAGADVDEIARVTDPTEAEAGSRYGQRIFAAWEALPFPTVAAIRGACVGGGTELALASTYRVASDGASTRIGLPEVRLGILPGWGGSTRLPRLVGLGSALDLILTGRTVSARTAFKLGLVDALLPEARFLDMVRDVAQERLDCRERPAAGRNLKEMLLGGNPLGRRVVFDQARKRTLEQTRGQYPAATTAIEVVRIGVEEGRRAGFDAEARAVAELATGRVSKNLVHVFRLTEEAKRDKGLDAAPREVRSVAVIGAGLMGGGIAQLVAHEAGVPVRLKDLRPEALASGMAHAAGLFDRLVKKRRLDRPEERRKMALIQPTLDDWGLSRVDLVIEAVVEKLTVKQGLFEELSAAVPAAAVLASNTSSLSVAAIGRRARHPERVAGMHFFNPVHKMPLVEVVAPDGADPAAVATVFAFAKRLGKTPVLVKDAPGFLVNRLLTFYAVEALWLLHDGHRIEDVDRVMTDWGMPVGPIALNDEVGIDVAIEVAHVLHEAWPERLPLPPWADRLGTDAARLGTKAGLGLYRYDGRERKEPDPAVYGLLGLPLRLEHSDAGRMIDRMVLRMVDEAARCLEEGVVRGPGELDLALVMGTGFPPFRGGLCRWADQEGVGGIVAALERLETSVGERFRPSEALRRVAAAGSFYG